MSVATSSPAPPSAGVPTRGRSVHGMVHGVLLVIAALGVPVLAFIGVQTLLDSRDGEVINPVLDPALPGYQALVEPSPTLLAVHTDPDGRLVGVSMLAMAGADVDGGAVLLVPPATLASVPDFGDLTLEWVQSLNGVETTHSLAEWILGIGIDDVVEVGHDDWAALTEPLGGLTLINPDELTGPDGVVFAAGEITLAPEEVGPYLAWLGPSEVPLNRLLRQEMVWEAWLEAVRANPDQAEFAGEQDRGLARFVPAIARGNHRTATLPVVPAEVADGEAPVFSPVHDAIARLIPELVPFPAGARPGERPLVRVLDASGRVEVHASAPRQVAMGGGQVVMIGNAEQFGAARTEVLLADESFRPVAESVAEALGVGSVQMVDYIDESADLIVLIGLDYSPSR